MNGFDSTCTSRTTQPQVRRPKSRNMTTKSSKYVSSSMSNTRSLVSKNKKSLEKEVTRESKVDRLEHVSFAIIDTIFKMKKCQSQFCFFSICRN